MKYLKILLYIIIAFAIAIGGYYSYTLYTKAKQEPKDALYIMPQNTILVFEAKNYSELQAKLESTNQIWDIIKIDNNISQSYEAIDSLWSVINKEISNDNSDPKIYFSIHYSGFENYKNLLSLSFKRAIRQSDLHKYLSKYGELKFTKFEGQEIISLSNKSNENKYYIINTSGNICISTYRPLIEKIILEQEAYSESETNRTNIKRMLKIAGKDAPANIFINYQYLYRLITTYANNSHIDLIKQLGNFTQFSVLDLNIEEKHLSLNGYSFSSDTTDYQLKLFEKNEALNLSIFEKVPENTIFLYLQSAKRLNEYLLERDKSNLNVSNTIEIKKYHDEFGINIKDYFYPWIKDEICFGLLSTQNSEGNLESFAIMNSYDIKEANQTLNNLQKIVSEKKGIPMDTFFYRTYAIKQIPLPYLLSKVFGKIFKPISKTFYTTYNEQIIFAESSEILKKYIDNLLINKTLNDREGFDIFKEHLSNESHIMIYGNAHYFNKMLDGNINSKTKKYLEHSEIDIQQLGDLCIQFIVNSNGAYTSINISTNDVEETEDNSSWQVALDYPMAKGPFTIFNHITNTKNTLVFDNHNTMYRINHLGKIEWAIPVAELPLGTPQIIDYYKNGKYQFVYNSTNYIYMYDLNGNRVENYPIELENPATAPLSVLDYDNNKKYRIIIPQSDGIIHNFKIDGQATTGWKLPMMPSLVSSTIQHYSLGTKDFILLSDTAGNVVFCNRRGEARIEAKLAFTNNSNTAFYKLDNKLVTTDLLGRLIFIDKNGEIEKVLLRDFSTKHIFYIYDINEDNKSEFIYYDKGSIYVYNHNHELLWSKELSFELNSGIQFTNKTLEDSTLFIIYNPIIDCFVFGNANSNLTSHNEFVASKYFLVYWATKNNKLRLISSKGRIISNYLIK